MSKRATQASVDKIGVERTHLKALAAEFRAAGDKELEQAVMRAYLELVTPAVTGAEGTMGVLHDAFRK